MPINTKIQIGEHLFIVFLLLVIGFQIWIIRSQGYEITTLRNESLSDRQALDSLRMELITPKISERKETHDTVRFELISDEDVFLDECLNIYLGDQLSYSYECQYDHIGFMKYCGEDGDSSFKVKYCRYKEPFDYHDFLLDMKGDGDRRYLILADLCTGTAANMNGVLIDTKDDFSVVGEVPVHEYISYPKINPDLIFEFDERVDYFGNWGAGYITVSMRVQKGKTPEYVKIDKPPFSLKQFMETLKEDNLWNESSSGGVFCDPILLCKQVVFNRLCCSLFSCGEMNKLHDYAIQLGYTTEECDSLEIECVTKIHGTSLYNYIHNNFDGVW